MINIAPNGEAVEQSSPKLTIIIVAKFQRDIIPKYNYNNLFTMKTSAK